MRSQIRIDTGLTIAPLSKPLAEQGPSKSESHRGRFEYPSYWVVVWSAAELRREIEKILGYRGRDELIHRDDLVLTS